LSAVISECGKYRYELRRPFGAPRDLTTRLFWIMLNPSTADAREDDPTIRRCRGYSEAWGYGGAFCVGNLYGWRSPEPKALRTSPDPIGPHNDDHLRLMAIEAEIIVLAWGSDSGPVKKRSDAVLERLWVWNRKFRVLGWSKRGEPRHPLMMSKDLKPIEWERVNAVNGEAKHG
jgi:hypothetical protein